MIHVKPLHRALGSLLGGNVLFGAGLFFHAFLYNFYLEAIGHPETVMGYAAASLTAGGLAALLPAGKLVDVLGPRLVLCIAVVLGALGLGVGAVVARPALIYGAAMAAGAGAGSWRVAQGPMIMGLTDAESRPRAFSWNVALLVGTGGVWILISASVPGWLETAFGFSSLSAIRAALLIGVVASVTSLLLFAVLPRSFEAEDRSGSEGHVARGGRPAAAPLPSTIVILVVLVGVWMLAPALVTPFFNLYFNREWGVPVAQIGIIFAAAHVVTAFAIFGSAELVGRFGLKRTLAGWMLAFGPALVALAVVGSLGSAIVLYLIQGFVSPATNPLIDQILLEMAPENRRGMVSSWRNAATEGSGAGGAAIGGIVLQSGSFGLLFAGAGVAGLIGAGLLLLGLTRSRPEVAATE